MSTHKHIEKVCVVFVLLALVLTAALMNADKLGIEKAENVAAYEEYLFDNSKVHTIDIQMDAWESFIETCENEEYEICKVVIDGETYANVGIRAKGNTSLSSVSSMNSDRYSFKIEFDQYDSTKTYHGLDKLSLNNLIQDNTLMKDYLTYQMMGEFGVSAPLCSYTYITVNGEDWGLYLAVEGVEESFLERNYGTDYGELYKPDSMSFGGGRGNGQKFDMEEFEASMTENEAETVTENEAGTAAGTEEETRETFRMVNKGGMGDGMGSSDVKLQYIDDDAESYANIFDNAKTDITEADQVRLIEAIKSLSAYENIESTVNIEQVIRYFVVHNFVCNGDSYTGSMIHNYYLYEEDGQMSMIPWDYNLAFGGFQSSDATSTVNEPIDSPVSGGSMEDRPMVNWIFTEEKYTELYHQYFAEFLENIDLEEMITKTAELIAPYVEKDPSKFCTYEEFETGVATLKEFCQLREDSIQGQLDGTIPSTEEGQNADSSGLIDASHINISDMGSMGMTMGSAGGMEMQMPDDMEGMPTVPTMPEGDTSEMPTIPEGDMSEMPTMPEGDMSEMPTMPGGDMSEMPTMPQGGQGGMMQGMPQGGQGEMMQDMPQGSQGEMMQGMPQGGQGGMMQDMPQGSQGEMMQDMPQVGEEMDSNLTGNSSITSWIIGAVSVIILGAGLIFAFRFKRYR